jgi:CheY-like chemotaxis protein
LGLATVHGTIEQFGGRIDVHSRPGVGTTFRIYLPLATAAAPGDQQADEQGEAPVEGSERILLVEDEVSVRRLAASFLTRLGYDVVQASNGLDALRLLERQSDVDLIISDVVMPEMSGGELVRRLRERGDETPVIYMSGYADDVMARSGVRRQRVEFIRKPFTQHELAQRVRQTLDRALSRAE